MTNFECKLLRVLVDLANRRIEELEAEREPNPLGEAFKDKERLDWLEARSSFILHTGQPLEKYHLSADGGRHVSEATTVREAIDIARTTPKPEEKP